jgi:hypothetical protein
MRGHLEATTVRAFLISVSLPKADLERDPPLPGIFPSNPWRGLHTAVWIVKERLLQRCTIFPDPPPLGERVMLDRLNSKQDITDKMLEHRAGERGLIGRLLGTKEHAPMNIAGITMIFLLVLLGVVILAPLDASVPRETLITALISAITFTLGLILGEKKNNRDE